MSVSQLSLGHIEKFRQMRMTEKTHTGRPAKPSTINRDIANLRAMLNKGVKYSKIDSNPIQSVSMLEENNVRERVLTLEQFQTLLQKCPESIRIQVLIAYHLPMRRSEILNLRWEEIDFKNGFIRLSGDRTKNKSGRVIPLHPVVIRNLKTLPRPIHGGYVFSFRNWRRKSFRKAVNEAGLGDFNFHDLRHCAINNLRLAGNDHFLIKQASGHKTDVAFRRYNLVTEDEMKGMKWYTEKAGESGTMDTYMDTSTSNTKG
jgi:integrase